MKLELIISHDLPALELTGGSIGDHNILRHAVMNDYIYSDEYLFRTLAGAFLQGQVSVSTSMWTLVEFWKDDYGPFVDYIEKKLSIACE
jgi:hypothetical protein